MLGAGVGWWVNEGCYPILHHISRLHFRRIRHIASLNWSPYILVLRHSVDCLQSVT
jgi:hypothetical protein